MFIPKWVPKPWAKRILACLILVSLVGIVRADWETNRKDGGHSGSNSVGGLIEPPISLRSITDNGNNAFFVDVMVKDGLFFVQSDLFTAYKFQERGVSQTAIQEWQFDPKEGDPDALPQFASFPGIYRDRVILATYPGFATVGDLQLIGFMEADGMEDWRETIANGTYAEMVVGGGRTFMIWGEGDGSFPAFTLNQFIGAWNSNDGAPRWSKEIDPLSINGHLTVAGSTLIRTEDNVFIAESVFSGSENWRFTDPGEAAPGMLAKADYDIIHYDGKLIISQGHRVFTLNASNGQPGWALPVAPADPCYSMDTFLATDGNHVVVYGVCGDEIVVLDFNTGQELWRREIGTTIPRPFTAISGGDVYALNQETLGPKLWIYDLATADLVGTAENMGNTVPTSIAMDKGFLYIAGLGDNGDVEIYEREPAEVEIEILAQPQCPGLVGGKYTYDYRITNNGPGPAADLEVRIIAQDSSKVFTSSAGNCMGEGTITCELGTLGAGESFDARLVVTPSKSGRLIVITDVSSAVADANDENDRGLSAISIFDVPDGGIDLTVTGMEITQAIQSPSNDVSLISTKPTLVRVFIDTGGGDVPGMSAELHGSQDGMAFPDSPVRMIAECGSLQGGGADRTRLSDTLNFLLPINWRKGDVRLRIELNQDGRVPETDESNNSFTQDIFFTDLPPICIKTYKVRTADSGGGDLAPSPLFGATPFGRSRIRRRALSLLPTGEIKYYAQSGILEEYEGFGYGPYEMSPAGDDDKWKLMTTLWFHDQFSDDPDECDDADARTLHLGVMDPRTAGRGSLGGSSSGPLDQLIVFMDLTDTGSRDFNNPRGGRTLAHEIGHNFGREHVDCGGPDGADEPYDYNGCELDDLDENDHFGVDLMDVDDIEIIVPLDRNATNTLSDLMSYAVDRWPSDYFWRRFALSLCAARYGTCHWPFSNPISRPAEYIEPAEVKSDREKILGAAETLWISGYTTDTTVITSVHRMPADMMSLKKTVELWDIQAPARERAAILGASQYTITMLDGGDSIIASEPFDPIALAEAESQGWFFGLVVPYSPAAAKIQVRDGATVLAERLVSANAPTVNVTAPTAGATIGNTMTVTWSGADVDGDDLMYSVQFSNDLGLTWSVLLDMTTDSSAMFATDLLAGGTNTCKVRVIVNDGVNVGMGDSDAFTVPPRDPLAFILNPEDGTTFALGQLIIVEGSGYDTEDGDLTAASLEWTLEGHGSIGTGTELFLPNLAPGEYDLMLTATDTSMQESTDTITIEVLAAPEPPPPASVGAWNEYR